MIRVESGSRLHFGLLSFGRHTPHEDETGQPPDNSSSANLSKQIPDSDPMPAQRCGLPASQFKFEPAREFGGVGVMVDQPRLCLELKVHQADVIECHGDPALERRVAEVLARWRRSPATATRQFEPASSSTRSKLRVTSKLQVRIVEIPPPHCGFGTGTQLALALAAGLNRLFDLPSIEASTLARQVGRGRRSAVGTYGFSSGGLIVDRGKLPGESLSPLACRVTLPGAWRFVIACDFSSPGLSGSQETHAFAQLPAVPAGHSREMFVELHDHLLPSATAGDFAAFAKSLWRYGSLAGKCFAPVQAGGSFSGAAQRWVDFARHAGFEGVGQTSWGPAVYVVTPDESTARNLVEQMRRSPLSTRTKFWIAAPMQTGAAVLHVNES